MKRIEFKLCGQHGQHLQEPVFVEDCSELPLAVMRALEDYLEAYEGKLELPVTIQIQSSPGAATC